MMDGFVSKRGTVFCKFDRLTCGHLKRDDAQKYTHKLTYGSFPRAISSNLSQASKHSFQGFHTFVQSFLAGAQNGLM